MKAHQPRRLWLFYILIIASLLAFAGLSSPKVGGKHKVKNLILLVGDGMGPQQISLALNYARLAPGSKVKDRRLKLEEFMQQGTTGYMMTYPYGAMVVDSAASATQLATGQMSRSEMIGVNFKGEPAETIIEKAKRLGKATGLVSNTRITHATPAAFAAHQAHRSMENEIAEDMVKVGPDVMLSAGLRYFLPKSVNDKDSATAQVYQGKLPTSLAPKSKRNDERDLLKEAENQGYKLAFDRSTLNNAKGPKILGLFEAAEMPDAIVEHLHDKDPVRNIPNLREMTLKALDVLSQDPDGFFLMVEGGQIDWAGHANDAGSMLHEMLRFDEVIGVVMEWAKQHKDTLVVLTADHETGSFGFSYSRAFIPKPSRLETEIFKNRDFKPEFNFGDAQVLDKMYNQKQSFLKLFEEFDALPKDQQTAKKLEEMVNKTSDFKIDGEQAARILATEKNQYYIKDHKYLGTEQFPKVDDFKEFYVYGAEVRTAILARQIAKEQEVVWGSGTHTSTPVLVAAFGPQDAAAQFTGLHHSTEVGKLMISLLGLGKIASR